MFRIRAEQVGALEWALLQDFEDRTVAHLRSFAPRLAQVAGEPALRRTIGLGVERAARHGFSRRGPVRLYLELMVLFGCDFDTDPLLPWAAEALGSDPHGDEGGRADRLHDAATAYINEVIGPDDAHAVEALRRIRRSRVDDFPLPRGAAGERALRRLCEIHERKCRCAGRPVLRGLIDRARGLAVAHEAQEGPGFFTFLFLPFTIGHGFANDPLYPWIGTTLNDPRVPQPARRVERLHTKAMTYLAEALAYLEGSEPDAQVREAQPAA